MAALTAPDHVVETPESGAAGGTADALKPPSWQMKRHTVDDLLARLQSQRGRADETGARQHRSERGPMATDFAVQEQMERRRDRMTKPNSWQSPVLPQPRSWMAQQIRSGLIGLMLGTLVMVPTAVWLKSQHLADQRVRGRVADVPTRFERMPGDGAASTPAARSADAPRAAVEAPPMLLSPPRPVARPAPAPESAATRTDEPATAPSIREPIQVASAPTAEPMPAQVVAPIATPTVQAPAVQTPPARPRADELLDEARRLIDDGDIFGARDVLQDRELERTPKARFLLAETFDPNILAAWGARGISAETDRARMLYEQALRDGVTAAAQRIRALEVR